MFEILCHFDKLNKNKITQEQNLDREAPLNQLREGNIIGKYGILTSLIK